MSKLNKVAMWIYHESPEPISEIESLLTKAGAVDEYIDVIFEDFKKEVSNE